MAYIEFQQVVKQYGEGSSRVMALDGASFRIEKGSLSLILGASGAGKNDGTQHSRRHGHSHVWKSGG
jgi:putative ABC transport system ATP-binding protein